MKRELLVPLAAACLLVAWTGCGRTPELFPGGGFEQMSELEKSPGDWYATVLPDTKDFVSFDWDAEVAHSGERSVSIAIDAEHPEDVIAYNWTKIVPGYEAGTSYELSGWVKTENLTSPVWIVAQCWDETKQEMLAFATTQQGYPITGTTDWTQVGVVFTVPEGTAEVRIRAGIATPDNNGGKAWFDDLDVREVS